MNTDTDVCDSPGERKGADEICWMIAADHPDVLAIERQSVPPHWNDDDLKAAVKSRHTMGNVATIGTGQNRVVVGFVVYHLRPKAIDILNMAVLADCRRQGIGRQIVARLVDKLSQCRRTQLQVIVGERNNGMQKFLQASGFVCDKVCRSQFENEDGYRFVYRVRE